MIYVTFLILVAVTVFYTFDVNGQSTPCPGPNEASYPCGTRCEDRCNGPRPSLCKGIQCEGFACRCKDGFVRNPYDNRCVRRDECPDDGCAPGEAAFACGKTCEGTCENPVEPKICQVIFCIKSDCRCDLYGGFVRNNQTGNCVRIGDC